jgi:hypothetical protein
MAVLLFLLTIVLCLLLLIGLVSPKTALMFMKTPTRAKVILVYGLSIIVLLFSYGIIHESSWELALKNPAEATEVSLKYKKLEKLPDELKQMTKLIELDLSKNRLSSLPDYIKDFQDLQVLDLSDNPITSIPIWIKDMPGLIELNLDNTNVKSLPDGLELVRVTYNDTPLDSAENYIAVETNDIESSDETDKEIEEDDRTESFGEFAMRRLLGKDYGSRRKFKKGEIYYNQPVATEQVDKIGDFMILMGFFNDDREASMLLDENDEGVFELMIVIVGEEALTEEVVQAFSSIEQVIQNDVFPENEFHLVLTDDEFDPIKTIE